MRGIARWTALIGLAAAIASLALAPAASAAPVETVTTNVDPGDGSCDASCSLRDAISEVDMGGLVNFAGGANPSTASLIGVGKNMTIAGNGVGATVIDGPANAGILNVGPFTVTIRDLRMTGGNATDGVAPGAGDGNPGLPGGAIINNGTLAISRVLFDANHAGSGSGPGGVGNGGTGGSGGAIANLPGAALSVDQSSFVDNTAGNAGNAVGFSTGGDAGHGGAIFSDGTSLRVTNSSFQANRAGTGGNGFASGEGGSGGAILATAAADILNSTLSGNLAGIGGGGFFVGGAGGDGGGFYASAGPFNVVSSTIAGNLAGGAGSGSGPGQPGIGGGLGGEPATLSVRNSILADNLAPALAPTGDHCETSAVVDGGGNISSSADSLCPASIAVANPVLGGLADNGGPTLTHALGAGSAAINAITACTDLLGAPLTTDQRGAPRPAGSPCDAGAFEDPTPVAAAAAAAPAAGAPTSQSKCSKRKKKGMGKSAAAAKKKKKGCKKKKKRKK